MTHLAKHAYFATLLTAGAFLLSAQTPLNPIRKPAAFQVHFAEPPVPADPLEFVTGDAKAVQSADQRGAVMKALSNAFDISNVRAYPYYRKTNFVSFGNTSSDGNWQLEDISASRGTYRWSAQGPSYSVVNLYNEQMLYSDQPAGSIPVRLAQVRSAIFFMRPFVGPRATIRVANATLNGEAVECVLLSHMNSAQGAVGGRNWEEEEYCIDTASGVYVSYSPAPGLYVVYDYSHAIHFHDRLIPNKFTITQAGRTIIDAQTTGVSDPPQEPALFQPTGLNQVGVGPVMTGPSTFRNFLHSADVPAGSAQFVVIHGMQAASGQISDPEVLASSNTALNAGALDFVSKWQMGTGPAGAEPGATPLSHEVIMTVMFTAAGPALGSQSR